MDAKQYILDKFNREYPTKGTSALTLIAVLADPRLKIELLPPPPRFEVMRDMNYFGERWYVVDRLAAYPDAVGIFYDASRAIDYAKWQNSLETE